MNSKRGLLLLGGLVGLGILADWASYFRSPLRVPGAREYVVQAGDSLLGIAKTFYGSEDYWRFVYRANEKRLSRSGVLQAGQALVLPVVRCLDLPPATKH